MARSFTAALSGLLLAAFLVIPAYALDKTKPVTPKAPSWAELTPQQKQVLGELQGQWEQQPDRLRINLIKVANKYPKMKPEEQERVRRRITHWASLTPEQRQAARARYKKIKQQPPEKQKEVKKKWETYQQQQGQHPNAVAVPPPASPVPARVAPAPPITPPAPSPR